MADSFNLYTGDGSTVTFSFTFEYLDTSDIYVTVDEQENTDWSFDTTTDPTSLTFNTAPANGTEILIYRSTDLDNMEAVFAPGSAIRAKDLNTDYDQLRLAIQEAKEYVPDTIIDDQLDPRYWQKEETVESTDTWESTDSKVATTKAIEDYVADTVTSEIIKSTDTWESSDSKLASTKAIEDYVADNTVDEAPKNGNNYVRKDGAWSELPTGGIVYRGQVSFVDDAPAGAVSGDLYLNDTEGTAGDWPGFTGEDVLVDDRALFDGTTWTRITSGGGGGGNDPDAVQLDDGGTKQVIQSAGLGISDGADENITLNADGSATFQGNVDCEGALRAGNSTASDINAGDFRVNATEASGFASVFARNHEAGGRLWYGMNSAGDTETSTIFEDGSATFAGSVEAGNVNLNASGFELVIQDDDDNNQVMYSSGSGLYIGNAGSNALVGTSNIRLLEDGSATFAGNVVSGATPDDSSDSVSGTSLNQGRIFNQSPAGAAADLEVYGQYYGTANAVSFTAAGAATFAGSVETDGGFVAGGNPINGTNIGFQGNWSGVMRACRDAGNIFEGYELNNSSATTTITCDGDATFAGMVRSWEGSGDSRVEFNGDGLSGFNASDTSVFSMSSNTGNATFTGECAALSCNFQYGQVNRSTTNDAFNCLSIANDNGNKIFLKGEGIKLGPSLTNSNESNNNQTVWIRTDGSAQFSGNITAGNVVFAAGTPNELNVRERITDLISRLDVIEANERVDDATDTSLLQLLANASARLDSIEARLTALEAN